MFALGLLGQLVRDHVGVRSEHSLAVLQLQGLLLVHHSSVLDHLLVIVVTHMHHPPRLLLFFHIGVNRLILNR
jgi:hypothetical protein